LVTADIVRGKVNPEDLRGVNAVVYNTNSIPVGIREVVFIPIILEAEKARQEVVLELWKEVLGTQ
jgi:hypothetical protein